jgi:serine phosphatase RsbU (regulator of sigma subunit)
MDFAEIALISPDFENRELLYISSGISMYRVRNGELTAFQQASRGFAFRLDYTGMSQRIPLEPGDVFYVFSDGVYDQIGGSLGKRLSKSRLLKMILDSDSLNLENGMNQIRNGLREWQGKYQQTDDRMLISFRF